MPLLGPAWPPSQALFDDHGKSQHGALSCGSYTSISYAEAPVRSSFGPRFSIPRVVAFSPYIKLVLSTILLNTPLKMQLLTQKWKSFPEIYSTSSAELSLRSSFSTPFRHLVNHSFPSILKTVVIDHAFEHYVREAGSSEYTALPLLGVSSDSSLQPPDSCHEWHW